MEISVKSLHLSHTCYNLNYNNWSNFVKKSSKRFDTTDSISIRMIHLYYLAYTINFSSNFSVVNIDHVISLQNKIQIQARLMWTKISSCYQQLNTYKIFQTSDVYLKWPTQLATTVFQNEFNKIVSNCKTNMPHMHKPNSSQEKCKQTNHIKKKEKAMLVVKTRRTWSFLTCLPSNSRRQFNLFCYLEQ